MLKLLRMDYIFNHRQTLITLAIFSCFILFAVNRIDSPRVFLVSISLMIGFAISLGSLGREDKFKTATLVCSLPVRRRTVVLSKYVSSWISMGVVLALSLALASLPLARIDVAEILTVKSLLTCLLLISVLAGFIIPFTIRFGLAGIIIFLVGGQLLGIVMLILAQFLGRGPNPLRTVITAIERGLRSLLYHEVTPVFLLELLAAIAIVNAASFFASRAIYTRRDL
jgi:ABC-type transport system involved in multi-copper enzyme maturation permease subunit